MTQYYSLLSVVFMMSFVVVFDRFRQDRSDSKFCASNLLGSHDVDRILQILSACSEC
jgi:hypothetical protein